MTDSIIFENAMGHLRDHPCLLCGGPTASDNPVFRFGHKAELMADGICQTCIDAVGRVLENRFRATQNDPEVIARMAALGDQLGGLAGECLDESDRWCHICGEPSIGAFDEEEYCYCIDDDREVTFMFSAACRPHCDMIIAALEDGYQSLLKRQKLKHMLQDLGELPDEEG